MSSNYHTDYFMLNIIISFKRKSTRHSWPIASLAHVQRKSPCQCVVRKHIIKGKPGLWIFTKSGNSIKSYHFLGIILRHYICYLRFCSHHLRISRHSQYRILTDNTFLLFIDGPFRMNPRTSPQRPAPRPHSRKSNTAGKRYAALPAYRTSCQRCRG